MPVEPTLVFPHQLFDPHPAIRRGHPVLLLEDPLFFGTDTHWPARMHTQKLLLHRASLEAYAKRLRTAGHEVVYLRNEGAGTTASLLETHLSNHTSALHLADPVDDLLSRRLRRLADRRGFRLHVVPSPNFLSPESFLDGQFPPGKKPFMARFYQAQRIRLGLLVDPHGQPEGGRWSFDTENRRRLPAGAPVPDPEWPAPPTDRVREAVAREFPHALGSAEAFRYPVTHEAATAWLEDFLRFRLPGFGDYEDAIATRHDILFHSVLTPCLNIGLLDPRTVVDRTVAQARHAAVPLNALEGFVRQVIGWREFMRAMYITRGVTLRRSNFWNFHRSIPACFYDGSSGIPPVDRVIHQLLRTGWCHHIERLMVLGNFFLLCRIHPDAVYRWFMELFVDSYDWVMVPNVYGMSQYADGGTFTTKPYLSGSNYIRKMSDHRAGAWCAVWDALFWTFIDDYHDVFAANPRLSMMARSCRRMGAKLPGHRKVAETFLSGL